MHGSSPCNNLQILFPIKRLITITQKFWFWICLEGKFFFEVADALFYFGFIPGSMGFCGWTAVSVCRPYQRSGKCCAIRNMTDFRHLIASSGFENWAYATPNTNKVTTTKMIIYIIAFIQPSLFLCDLCLKIPSPINDTGQFVIFFSRNFANKGHNQLGLPFNLIWFH